MLSGVILLLRYTYTISPAGTQHRVGIARTCTLFVELSSLLNTSWILIFFLRQELPITPGNRPCGAQEYPLLLTPLNVQFSFTGDAELHANSSNATSSSATTARCTAHNSSEKKFAEPRRIAIKRTAAALDEDGESSWSVVSKQQ